MDEFNKFQVFFDDKLVDFNDAQLSVASSAVLYGLSVYTVFAANKTESGMAAFRLKDHYQRLIQSAHIIGIDTFADNWSYERFEQTAKQLISANNIDQDVLVRATVHVSSILAGTRSRGLTTVVSMFICPASPILPQTGAKLKSSVWRRVADNAIPARAKVNGAYVNSVLAKQDAIDSGYDDCIFLDASGHVCELSAANIFLVRDGVLITPDTTSDLLEGINRRTIIEIAKEQGIPVQERAVDLTELYVADEVFACGTSAFVAPVIEVDARQIGNGQPGPISSQISKLHKQVLHGKSELSSKYLTNL